MFFPTLFQVSDKEIVFSPAPEHDYKKKIVALPPLSEEEMSKKPEKNL